MMDKSEELKNYELSVHWQNIKQKLCEVKEQCENLRDGQDLSMILDGVEQIADDRYHLYYALSKTRKEEGKGEERK